VLTSIELENYRGFARYRLGGLAQVNLLVGKNNCGKTSVLEAAHLIASGGDLGVLTGTAWQRGEVVVGVRDRERHREEMFPVLSHFFHGHELQPGTFFSVGGREGADRITVRVVDIDQLDEQGGQQKFLFDDEPGLFYKGETSTGIRSCLAVCFEGTSDPTARESWTFPLTDEGAVPADVIRRYRRAPRRERNGIEPVHFITPDSLEPPSMSEMWNKVITEGRESEVIGAMRILAPDLKNIFFLSGESAYRFGGRAGVLAAFEGTPRRDPLGSHGDGMRRLLALSLSLIRSESGTLLVDEIDTGLHYSVMGDMWRLVTEAARRSGVQVFATTHSSDCVRGLAWLCQNHPELAAHVSLQKVDCQLEEAVALHAEEIALAVDQGMEVR